MHCSNIADYCIKCPLFLHFLTFIANHVRGGPLSAVWLNNCPDITYGICNTAKALSTQWDVNLFSSIVESVGYILQILFSCHICRMDEVWKDNGFIWDWVDISCFPDSDKYMSINITPACLHSSGIYSLAHDILSTHYSQVIRDDAFHCSCCHSWFCGTHSNMDRPGLTTCDWETHILSLLSQKNRLCVKYWITYSQLRNMDYL